jgi:DNA-directed RNA polymerase subunit M/transcription elongation factor TFIIS
MSCDRCGGELETYELEGRETRSCRDCGYVDVPVRHEPSEHEHESWDNAISRFQEEYAEATDD